MQRRAAGILLHISSLPSAYGIGDLGPWAYRFADFLAQARQGYWQILPLNPTSVGCGNCPYSSDSAFAGNPLLISPDLLLEQGLLRRDDFERTPPFPDNRVAYKEVAQFKARLLARAFERYHGRLADHHEFQQFCRDQVGWLEDYSLFRALKKRFGAAVWSDWPRELSERNDKAIESSKIKFQEEMRKEQFEQYLFYQQWDRLKRYCNGKNILIIGDLPIYVSYDSADVWANQGIFKLDKNRRPSVVAGVPPDYFSATGQLWGNPLYRWDALQADGYGWWMKRVEHNLRCFDKVRLDHFRGFVACWEVAASETTAISGRWVKAAGEDFFAALVKRFGTSSIFAEDLGFITPDVREVMERFGFPGMKVLLFAFGGDTATHPYAPHNYPRDCVVYTGTHDNNTVLGWFREEAGAEERRRLCDYVGREVTEEEVAGEMVRLALASPADTAIVPMQDILGLGAEARMNRPSTTYGNWKWRLLPDQITPSLSERLAALTELSGRAPA